MPDCDQNPSTASGEPASPEAVTVDIYDQTYHLRGDDPAYIQQLAEFVDSKMRLVASHGRTVDSLRVAVLAAINIADELTMLERRYQALAGSAEESSRLRDRAQTLTGLLDSILEDERKLG